MHRKTHLQQAQGHQSCKKKKNSSAETPVTCDKMNAMRGQKWLIASFELIVTQEKALGEKKRTCWAGEPLYMWKGILPEGKKNSVFGKPQVLFC